MRQLYNIRSRRRSSSTPYLDVLHIASSVCCSSKHGCIVQQIHLLVGKTQDNEMRRCSLLVILLPTYSNDSFVGYQRCAAIGNRSVLTSVLVCCVDPASVCPYITRQSFHPPEDPFCCSTHRHSSMKRDNPATRTFDKGTFATNSILCCISKFDAFDGHEAYRENN